MVELGERRLVSMATGSEMKFPTLYVTRQPCIVAEDTEQVETESVGYADDEPGVDEPEVSIFLS